MSAVACGEEMYESFACEILPGTCYIFCVDTIFLFAPRVQLFFGLFQVPVLIVSTLYGFYATGYQI